FLTPDWSASPAFVPYAKLGNPQSLNLYAYAGNNPTSYRDSDGHEIGPVSGLNIGTEKDPIEAWKQATNGIDWDEVKSQMHVRYVEGNQNGQNQNQLVPTILPNGRVIIDPKTGKPLPKPSNVSLADNAKAGEKLRGNSFWTKSKTLFGNFSRGGAMDYQRVAARNGVKFDKDLAAFGNFNYGLVVAAAGVSLDTALLGSGAENLKGGGNKSGPWGNDPENQYWIEQGYEAYQAGEVVPGHGDLVPRP
ncbi:MAG: hypothetical protein JO335_11270, partial [Sphingomonas sp.]|nr:hypothetical protein [Sphingomonas sp.]